MVCWRRFGASPVTNASSSKILIYFFFGASLTAFFGARAGALLVAYVCRDFFGRFLTTKERFWTFFLWVAKLPMRATFAERPMCVRAASASLALLRLRGDAC